MIKVQKDGDIAGVLDKFRQKPHLAIDMAKKRREEIEEKFPEIKQIDERLAQFGMKIFAESMRGEDGLQDRLDALYRENTELRAKKGEILLKNGYSPDYTEVRYECDRCHDSGYVGVDMCECLKKEIIKARCKNSGLGKYFKNMTFENFSLDYYPKQYLEEMADTLNFCKGYVQDFSPNTSPSIFMMGATGLGKTHLSAAIAGEVVKKGFDVVYESAPTIISYFEKERFAKDDLKTQRLCECDLLVIDDLGVEAQSKGTVGYIYTLINTRILASLPTVITTNFTPTQLKSTYDDRIVSRLFGEFTVFVFKGDDIRLKKVKL